ncbi:SDR family oxidoreductase [Achromobacter aloeverae]|uniref:NAD(P)-dependent oxidoreductase n=1 Tax=Achromobacter aloeverae TaxID=1750518 RepID=A0A4Q1HI47_9BURK|nr:SDR family oxidoreductase [Achromobacter aloeverae]RXN87055.1 NAD(P)-dependent oxidoreductase [Achromobacter aloeverae]
MLLITGGTGQNGRATLSEFIREKRNVRVLVRSLEKASGLGLDKFPQVELVQGDMGKPGTLQAALAGIERVLMISSPTPDMLDTQCRFIDACKSNNVRHVIKFSGAESGIGFDPSRFRFTQMHEDIEDYLEGSGLAWTHVRPSQFMQVYLREAGDVAKEGVLRLPFGEIELSPIDVSDIAKVTYRLLREGGHEGVSLDMTGPEALTMSDIAERIAAATGAPVRYEPITARERRERLLASGMPPSLVDALDEQLAERLARPKSRVDLSAHAMFGIWPTTFAEFAKRHAAAFRPGV